MTISICAYNLPARELLALAVAADELGFDSLWLGEHIVLPLGYASEHSTAGNSADHEHVKGAIVSPDTELVDPWVGLAAISGATRQLRVATGVYILPLRHPLLTARAACTLHEVSGGRFMLGVGSGWLREEFDAFGVPFEERGRRLDETLDVLRKAWAGGPFEHRGNLFSFGPLQVTASPAEVPIILGGNTPRALRRAALVGNGWFSSGTPTFDAARHLRDTIYALRSEHGRTEPYRCYFRVEGCDPEVIEGYRREGIDDVVIWADQLWPSAPLDDQRAALAVAGTELGLTPARSTVTSAR
ncbi:MAG TPA: TIGR03619 family F420-dependent LLM class oxidoreductase [Acidimicrobiales bacterium]|nr:TIGR03619 family F420-dependent LLM class oxidoreductase [Acidimicrobiales bacterium]